MNKPDFSMFNERDAEVCRQGYRAAMLGVKKDNNPYAQDGDVDHDSWNLGYDDFLRSSCPL